MKHMLMGGVALLMALGTAQAALADGKGKYPYPDHGKDYIVEKVDAKKYCIDHYKYDEKYHVKKVELDKGDYKIYFESDAYYFYSYYKKLKIKIIYGYYYEYKHYKKTKKYFAIKDGEYYKLDLPYKTHVYFFFKDSYCDDNKGYGKLKIKVKDEKPEKPEKPEYPKPPYGYKVS